MERECLERGWNPRNRDVPGTPTEQKGRSSELLQIRDRHRDDAWPIKKGRPLPAAPFGIPGMIVV
jgi:hypothetical protein